MTISSFLDRCVLGNASFRSRNSQRTKGKIRLSILCGLASFLMLGGQVLAEPTVGPTVLPVEPAELLDMLPPAPPNWKLTASHAANRMSDSSAPETLAVRDYLFVPPANEAATAGLPKKVEIVLFDTANDSMPFHFFDSFHSSGPPGANSGNKSFTVDGATVVQLQTGSDLTLDIEISKRFLVSVKLANMSEDDRDDWLKLVNIPQLIQKSAAAPQVPMKSGMVTLSRVDELNPKFDSKWQASYITPADMERSRKLNAGKR